MNTESFLFMLESFKEQGVTHSRQLRHISKAGPGAFMAPNHAESPQHLRAWSWRPGGETFESKACAT
jgi:hypothetical protein